MLIASEKVLTETESRLDYGPKPVDVAGVPVVPFDSYDQALDCIEKTVEAGQKAFWVAMNPEKCFRAWHESELLDMLNRADVGVCDGSGMSLASGILNGRTMKRVTGCDLFFRLMPLAAKKGWRVFLLGGSAESNSAARSKLLEQFPDLRIVGNRDGYFEDSDSVVEEINASQADLLFVAMGSPKQEDWIWRHRDQIDATFCMGIGGTLDVAAGAVRRAPLIMRKIGAEWFYQLVTDPRKRWPRQKVFLPFMMRVIGRRLFSGGRSAGWAYRPGNRGAAADVTLRSMPAVAPEKAKSEQYENQSIERKSTARRRVPFLGLLFDDLSKQEALDRIEQFIEQGIPRKIFTPNVALLIWARKDEFLKKVYNSGDMTTVDGMAIYYAMRIMGTPVKESLSASLLFYPLLELCQKKGYGIYMVGAKQEIVEKAVENLKKEYPGIPILGSHHGYFDMENPPEDLIRDIKEKQPKVLLVGMSTPYKEKFVVSNMQEMGVPVSLGVGGMFDIAAGEADFAPEWIRKCCLEWLYRLLQEPRRMWKRYLTTNSVFLWLFFKALIRRKLGLPSQDDKESPSISGGSGAVGRLES